MKHFSLIFFLLTLTQVVKSYLNNYSCQYATVPRGFKDLEKIVLKVFTTITSQETNKHKTIRDLTFCTIYILIILTVKTHMKLSGHKMT